MPLPTFLGPPSPLVLAAAGAGNSKKLAFTIQSQTQSNWCWAAVSTSVSHFYDASSVWTQCQVASSALPVTVPPTNCCQNPQDCDQPFFLDVALGVTGNFRNRVDHALSFVDIQKEISADTPIGCRVGWFDAAGQLNGLGHFMIIAGWLIGATGTQYIDIADPIYLNTQILYEEFAASYQTGGEWTHSYLTQPSPPAAGGGMAAVSLIGLDTSDWDAIGA
jgi:Papain-like cysteine protease AvrRpt2